MQHYVIPHNGTWGVPTDEVFLPAVLKQARGFKTAHTGKHHMGMAKWRYTPTFRGYDSFVGYYGGECTYFGCYYDTTYDMHRDMQPECGPGCSKMAWDLDSTYSTYIFTDRAVEVIEETDPDTDRLFLYVGEPHSGGLRSARAIVLSTEGARHAVSSCPLTRAPHFVGFPGARSVPGRPLAKPGSAEVRGPVQRNNRGPKAAHLCRHAELYGRGDWEHHRSTPGQGDARRHSHRVQH